MLVFGELYEFNEQLILNLKYRRNSVKAVAKQFKFVPDILQGIKLLEGDDGKIIEEYAANLGKSDALSQIDYLNEKSENLKKLKEESLADYKRYSSLYIKIFFLIGVLAAILLY